MDENSEGRLSGGLIIAAVLGALVLMMHHPTSFEGPDDGLLMNDWSNSTVHGAMVVCLFLFRFAFGTWARRLGREYASVRAGTMAFDAGMTAFIAASVIAGSAAGSLAGQTDSETVRIQMKALGAVNLTLANLGMILTAAAIGLWAIRMLRLNALTRVAGTLGLIVAAAAAGWMVIERGTFGLYPATIATMLFGVWSSLVALRMMAGEKAGDAG